MAMLDLRKTDERTNVLPNPFWVKSAALTTAANGAEAVFFSFPAAKGIRVLVHYAFFQVTTAFNGTPSIDIGIGTIATDAVTTAGTVSVVDADEIVPTASITEGTIGIYEPAAGDALTRWAAGLPMIITPADSTVPVIYATYTATTPTTGVGYLYLLMSEVHA